MGSSDSRVSGPSQGQSQSTGSDWQSRIYFDKNVELDDGEGHFFTAEELQDKLRRMIDPHGNNLIKTVMIYKIPLRHLQSVPTDLGFVYHTYVVFESEDRTVDRTWSWSRYDIWWWSLEKNTDYITLQRSKDRSMVVNKYRKKKRIVVSTKPEIIIRDEGNITLQQLVEYMYETDEVNNKYDVEEENCQKFAKIVFDKIAKYKNWNWKVTNQQTKAVYLTLIGAGFMILLSLLRVRKH